jgi:CyaY protein
MATAASMEEKVYRQLVDDVFRRVDAAFERVDPDLAECTVSQGTLTVLFKGTQRLILSPQTPVRQIWVAFRDRAWHFDRDAQTGAWRDDRGQDVELFALVEQLTRDNVGESISVAR